jgi:uncharacterized membrane protein
LATIAGALLGGGLTQGAVVHKEADGNIKFVETKDLSASQGAKLGGLAGAVLGIIAGPIGVIGGGAVGAGVGSLAAKLRDSGFPNDQLRGLGEGLSQARERSWRWSRMTRWTRRRSCSRLWRLSGSSSTT